MLKKKKEKRQSKNHTRTFLSLFFDYRGVSLKIRDKTLLRRWAFFLLFPLIVFQGVVHWLITIPMILGQSVETMVWVVLGLLTAFLNLAGWLFACYIIRSSRFGYLKGGFFLFRKRKQDIAQLLFENDYVLREKRGSQQAKEKIKFPPIYYLMDRKTSIDRISFKLGNKFQDKFLQMGKDFENLFLADLVGIDNEPGYVHYNFLMDNSNKRLNFEDVTIQDGKIEFMKGVIWNYDKQPHMLITGGTGGGKTYFIYMLIAKLAEVGRVWIADPKKADLADLGELPAFEGKVAYQTKDIFAQMKLAVELMDKRYAYMKQQDNYTMGKNYAYYGMKPEFFIVDEWAAFITALPTRGEYTEFNLYESVVPLVLKARQAGVFFIVATQRADAMILKSSIRDNLMCKLSLGILSETGYMMTFGDENKNKAFKNRHGLVGRGYIDVGTGVPNEFYAPYISPDFDILAHFTNMEAMPFTDVSSVELLEAPLSEEAKKNVTADMLSPVYEDLGIDDYSAFLVDESEEAKEKTKEKIPLKRLGKTERAKNRRKQSVEA